MALGAGALGKDDLVTAEQARHPDLPRWQTLIEAKGEVVVPANTEQFLLWDLDNYYSAYPLCEVSGGAGARLAWTWAESLYLPKSEAKGQRDEFIGKTFRGMTDTFLPGGGAHRKFSTLWWRAGRWCLLSIKTADRTADDSPARAQRKPLSLRERRHALTAAMANSRESSRWRRAASRCARTRPTWTARSTSNSCTTAIPDWNCSPPMCMTRDDRLVKRAIELFDFSRRNWGFVNERLSRLSAPALADLLDDLGANAQRLYFLAE